jgi:hypothetical protein
MITTVTLDPDVEQLLRVAMKESGISFKEALNQAIRRGLSEDRNPRRFAQQTFSMGAEANISVGQGARLGGRDGG